MCTDASHGARSLDDVMRALHRRSLTAPIDEFGLRELSVVVFRELVAQELGEEGVQRFAAVVLEGELAEPAADAFGPCFRRVARATALFQLGFDEPRSLAGCAGRPLRLAVVTDGLTPRRHFLYGVV